MFKFLTTYFPDKFWAPFSSDQKQMVLAILHRAKYGGDQAIAAPRGGGKTTITECVIIYALLIGLVRFPLIVGANSEDARSRLENIKAEFEMNELLAEDYPEICMPIKDVSFAPQRGRKQLGRDRQPTRIEWPAHTAVFPMVKSTLPKEKKKWHAAAGSRIETRGLDAAIRGINRKGMRPDFVLLDDPETRESADSEYQTELRERTIDRDIAGVAGKGRRLARVALVTIQNRRCLAYRLTDRTIKHSWGGTRYRIVQAWPERTDLWEQYLEIRKVGQQSGDDPDGREAHAFYLANRSEMDCGAVVNNDHVHDAGLLADGSKKEVSSLQRCYNLVGDLGMDAFLTEHQNDPPADRDVQTSGITPQLVASRINGLPQRFCPNDPNIKITAFCDLGKYGLHWAAAWWLPGAIGGIIDYGIVETHGNTTGADQPTIERSILRSLLHWRDELLREPFRDMDGNERKIDLALIDSGDWSKAVDEFLRQVGGLPFGKSKGIGGNFQHGKDSPERKVGDNWFISKTPTEQFGLFCLAADYWKRWVHDRWLTPTLDESNRLRPGALSLWADNEPRRHHSFAHHICAEEWREEFVKGKGIQAKWVKVNRNNHWLDCCYGLAAAANMVGVRLFDNAAPRGVRRAIVSAGSPRPDGRAWL